MSDTPEFLFEIHDFLAYKGQKHFYKGLCKNKPAPYFKTYDACHKTLFYENKSNAV